MKDPVRQRLCRLIEERQTTMAGASRAIGRNHAYVQQFIRTGRPERLPEQVRIALAEFFRVDEEAFRPETYEARPLQRTSAAAADPEPAQTTARSEGVLFVPELAVRTSAEGEIMIGVEDDGTPWPISLGYVRSVLGIRNPADLAVVDARGDGMEPVLRPGDRVLIDTGDRIPTPPGIFVLWDGLGTIVKRVEHIHGSDPTTYRITSDNPGLAPYERRAEDANIIGRAIWKTQRL